MNAIADKFAQWDAAYVLAHCFLVERREFEEHLASCPACQAAVSELAALPGMLAQISPADAAMLSLADDSAAYAETPESGAAQPDVIDQGPPPSLLPKMIKTVRTRRRRIVAAVAGIAAAVLFVIGGIAVGTGLPRWDRTTRIGSHFHQSRRRGSRQSLTSFRSKTAPRSRWNACTPRLTIRDPAALKRPIRSSWSTGPVRPRRSRNGPRPRTSRCDRVAPLR